MHADYSTMPPRPVAAVLLHMHPPLARTATHCNTLQHTATHCNTLQHMSEPTCSDGTQCTTLQLTATYCNALQHTTALASSSRAHWDALQHDGTCFSSGAHCNTLQHTHRTATHATHCAWFLLWCTLPTHCYIATRGTKQGRWCSASCR